MQAVPSFAVWFEIIALTVRHIGICQTHTFTKYGLINICAVKKSPSTY